MEELLSKMDRRDVDLFLENKRGFEGIEKGRCKFRFGKTKDDCGACKHDMYGLHRVLRALHKNKMKERQENAKKSCILM